MFRITPTGTVIVVVDHHHHRHRKVGIGEFGEATRSDSRERHSDIMPRHDRVPIAHLSAASEEFSLACSIHRSRWIRCGTRGASGSDAGDIGVREGGDPLLRIEVTPLAARMAAILGPIPLICLTSSVMTGRRREQPWRRIFLQACD